MRDRRWATSQAEALVAKMTLEEKFSQLKYDAPAIPRLGVPGYNWWNEALHGVARAGSATIFPQAIGMAACFDDELLKEVGQVIAVEGRAKYNAYASENDRDIYKGLTFWSPNVNIFRDPRWGRGHETYGEDPYLSGSLGTAFVKGLQGDGEVMTTAACVKHFAVHSGPEALRHEFDAIANPHDLWDTYLPAFEMVVKDSQVEAVMGAYNRTNGEPCCASPTLMNDILRGKWEFEGHYVSDCWAIRDFHTNHGITKDAKESAALALKMGCDVNCGNTYLHLMNAYEHGMVDEKDVDTSLVRLFTARYLLGIMDGQSSEFDQIPYNMVECKSHLQLSEKVAEKSIVMLKNDGILPLDKSKLNTIGVIGPNANSRSSLIGNYHGTASEYITVLEGIQRYVGDDVRVLYSEGSHLFKDRVEVLAWEGDRLSEAKVVAKNSDVVVLVVGLDETLEGEEGDTGNAYASGDKGDLQLPPGQRALLEAVAETGTPVILCMMAGSNLDFSYAMEHFQGILQLWYPGARGGLAVSSILFGDVSPSGKLPLTFYDGLDQLPDFADYSMKGRTYRYLEKAAQYPFGFGLTYGSAQVESAGFTKDEDLGIVTATVQNTGNVAIEEVVQVYVKSKTSKWANPNPRLVGYKRIALGVGERVEVKIPLYARAFEVVNDQGEVFQDGDTFAMFVGISGPDARSVELMGQAPLEIEVILP